MPNDDDHQITEEIWRGHENYLLEVGEGRLNKYTMVLMNDKQPFGTCVLLRYKKRECIITAAHVAQKIEKKGYERIRLVIKPDDHYREPEYHPAEYFDIKYWDPTFSEDHLLENPYHCKDLAVIEIPIPLIGIIKAVKEYVTLPDEFEQPLELNSNYFGHGLIKIDNKNQMTTFGIVLSDNDIECKNDYYTAKAKESTFGSRCLSEPSVLDFRGYSGGGLFQKKQESIKLVGIAFYQDQTALKEKGEVLVAFHGPKSIANFMDEIC